MARSAWAVRWSGGRHRARILTLACCVAPADARRRSPRDGIVAAPPGSVAPWARGRLDGWARAVQALLVPCRAAVARSRHRARSAWSCPWLRWRSAWTIAAQRRRGSPDALALVAMPARRGAAGHAAGGLPWFARAARSRADVARLVPPGRSPRCGGRRADRRCSASWRRRCRAALAPASWLTRGAGSGRDPETASSVRATARSSPRCRRCRGLSRPHVGVERPLPSLQQPELGTASMGWLDFAAPALLAILTRDRVRAAAATGIAGALWGLLLLFTSPIAATPPVLAGLVAGGRAAPRARRVARYAPTRSSRVARRGAARDHRRRRAHRDARPRRARGKLRDRRPRHAAGPGPGRGRRPHVLDRRRASRDADLVLDLAADPRADAPWGRCAATTSRSRSTCSRRPATPAPGALCSPAPTTSPACTSATSPTRRSSAAPTTASIRPTLRRVTTRDGIRPDGPYGVGKALGEAAGRFYAEEHGLSVVCLRIGTVNREGRPRDVRQFATLLTHADLIRLVESSLRAPASVASRSSTASRPTRGASGTSTMRASCSATSRPTTPSAGASRRWAEAGRRPHRAARERRPTADALGLRRAGQDRPAELAYPRDGGIRRSPSRRT